MKIDVYHGEFKAHIGGGGSNQEVTFVCGFYFCRLVYIHRRLKTVKGLKI